MRSREEMVRIIQSGRSVICGDRIVERVEDLPSGAELARLDPKAASAEEARLRAELAKVNEQLAALQGGQSPAGGEAKQEEKPGPTPKELRQKELAGIRRDSLVAVAGKAGLDTEGNVDELRARILAAEFPALQSGQGAADVIVPAPGQ